MFGYILPFKPELKMREWTEYRAYYCGLCKELGREYGLMSRFVLNYDFVLPAIISDALSGEVPCKCAEKCIASPFRKKCICKSSSGIAAAADALVLSVYYKVFDDCSDERGFKKIIAKILLRFMRKAHAKAAAKRPELDDSLRTQTQRQQALESRQSTSLDEAAEPTGIMTGSLFAAMDKHGQNNKALYRLGLCIGKIVYYLDAAEDYVKDEKDGSYNAFLLRKDNKDQCTQNAKQISTMFMGEAALCYNLLELKLNKGLVDNIIFLGLGASISKAGDTKTKIKHNDVKM